MKKDTERRSEEYGGVFVFLLGIVGIVLLLCVLFFSVLGKVVPPNYIGVRQNYFSLGFFEQGFKKDGLSPGLHWQVPGFSVVHLLPRTFQFVNFNQEEQYGDFDRPGLDIKTTDGSTVKVDITLVVRFFEKPRISDQDQNKLEQNNANSEPASFMLPNHKSSDEGAHRCEKVPFIQGVVQPNHGGPKDLITNFTEVKSIQLQKFSEKAEKHLRSTLSTLSTTDYYNPCYRESAALASTISANKEVNPLGIEVWGVLIRRYLYAEKSIDDQIFAKNLQDQTERLNAALTALAKAKSETERERALGDAKIRDLQVDGESKVNVTRSEAALFEAKKKAEGDLLVATAKAEIDGKKARALTEVAGADVYIARELTPLLGTLKGGVVSDLDPFNISDWVERRAGNQNSRKE